MHKERNAFGRQPPAESALLRALRCDGSRRTQAYGGEGAIVAKQFKVIFLVAVTLIFGIVPTIAAELTYKRLRREFASAFRQRYRVGVVVDFNPAD